MPGLRAFLEKHAATGSIATSHAGTASPVAWSAWFHSPASLHQNYAWQDQLVFVFQRGAGAAGAAGAAEPGGTTM